jgi:uncharacterized protein YneF (UPF0154 family)
MTNDIPATDSQRLIRQHYAAHNKRRYAKAVLLILVAVLAGVVIGVGGTLLYARNKLYRLPPNPRAIGEAMLEHMRGLVALTPDEETEVKGIIDEHVDEVDALRKSSFATIREVFRRMNGKIETVIGPDRMKVWREDKEKRYGRRHAGEHPRR